MEHFPTDLHEIWPCNVRDGRVDDPHRVWVDHRRTNKKVKYHVDADGIHLARFSMTRGHQESEKMNSSYFKQAKFALSWHNKNCIFKNSSTVGIWIPTIWIPNFLKFGFQMVPYPVL